MGFVGSLGNVVRSIGSGVGGIGGAGLRAVAPGTTDLLKNIVGTGFDIFKGITNMAAYSLGGPMGILAGYLVPFVDKGIDALKGEFVGPRQVPGAESGSNPITMPALGTPERSSSTGFLTAAVGAAIGAVVSRIGGSGQSAEDHFANLASGLTEPPIPKDGATEGELIRYQAAAQKYSRLMDMYSKLIQAQHDMKKGIIANFRV